MRFNGMLNSDVAGLGLIPANRIKDFLCSRNVLPLREVDLAAFEFAGAWKPTLQFHTLNAGYSSLSRREVDWRCRRTGTRGIDRVVTVWRIVCNTAPDSSCCGAVAFLVRENHVIFIISAVSPSRRYGVARAKVIGVENRDFAFAPKTRPRRLGRCHALWCAWPCCSQPPCAHSVRFSSAVVRNKAPAAFCLRIGRGRMHT